MRAQPMIEQVVSPAPRDEWERLARSDPFAMADHTPAWLAAFTRPVGWQDGSRLYRLADGRSVVLPLLRVGRGASTVAASYPSGRGFGGLVGEGAHDADVISAVLADLAGLGWASVRVRPDPLVGWAWADAAPRGARLVPRRAHVLDLSPGADALVAAMRKSVRRRIRQWDRGGLEVQCGVGGDLLEEYQRLWWPSVDRWADRQHEPRWLSRRRALVRDPPARLARLAESLGDRFQLWVARMEGVTVAANLVVMGPAAHVTRSALDRDRVGSSGVMQYLDWLAIQAALAKGCRYVHLGESGESASLALYKESLGAVAHDYAEVRLERLPITPADRAARQLVKSVVGFREARDQDVSHSSDAAESNSVNA